MISKQLWIWNIDKKNKGLVIIRKVSFIKITIVTVNEKPLTK